MRRADRMGRFDVTSPGKYPVVGMLARETEAANFASQYENLYMHFMYHSVQFFCQGLHEINITTNSGFRNFLHVYFSLASICMFTILVY